MAGLPRRYLKTMIWSDERFRRLSAEEKLILIYLIQNPYIGFYGVIDIMPAELIADEVGLPFDIVKEALFRLEEEGHILRDGYKIYVCDFLHHQGKTSLNQRCINVFEIEKFKLPEKFRERIIKDFNVSLESLSKHPSEESSEKSSEEFSESSSGESSEPPSEPPSEPSSEGVRISNTNTNTKKDTNTKKGEGGSGGRTITPKIDSSRRENPRLSPNQIRENYKKGFLSLKQVAEKLNLLPSKSD